MFADGGRTGDVALRLGAMAEDGFDEVYRSARDREVASREGKMGGCAIGMELRTEDEIRDNLIPTIGNC